MMLFKVSDIMPKNRERRLARVGLSFLLVAALSLLASGCMPGGTFVDYRKSFRLDRPPVVVTTEPILTANTLTPHNTHRLTEVVVLAGNHSSPIADIAFSDMGRTMFGIHATGGWVEGWDIKENAHIFETKTGPVGIIGAAFSPDLKYVAQVAGANRTLKDTGLLADFDGIRIYLVETGEMIWQSRVSKWSSPSNMAAWSPDGTLLAEQDSGSISVESTGQWTGGLAIGLSIIEDIEGPPADLTSVSFDSTGKWLLVGTDQGNVDVEGIRDNKESDLLSLPDKDFVLNAISSPSNHYIAAVGTTRLVVWDTAKLNRWFSGGGINLYVTHDYTPAADLAFSPDGKLLAVGMQDMWQIWSVEQGKLLVEHPQGSYALTFSPDGRLFVWGDLDGNVHIWGISDEK